LKSAYGTDTRGVLTEFSAGTLKLCPDTNQFKKLSSTNWFGKAVQRNKSEERLSEPIDSARFKENK